MLHPLLMVGVDTAVLGLLSYRQFCSNHPVSWHCHHAHVYHSRKSFVYYTQTQLMHPGLQQFLFKTNKQTNKQKI